MLKVLGSRPSLNRILTITSFLALVTAIFFFYIWHLGTLTPGFSSAETAATTASSSIRAIVDNPLFAPHKLAQFGFQAIGEDGAFWMRLVSVLFALAFLVFFYFLLKMWFGKFISLIGTLLLAATPALILVARSATAEVLFLAPIAIIASFVWFTRTDRKTLAWWTIISLIALSLYVPGMIYFLLLGLAILYRPFTKTLDLVNRPARVASWMVAIALLAPLVAASVNDLSVLRQLLLIPDNLPGTLEVLKSVVWSALTLFVKARDHFDFIIDSLPLLSGIQMVLIAFGLYALFSRAKKEFYLILMVVAVGVVSAGLNNMPSLLIPTLPVLGILAATGLRYLYGEWRGVFPINPLPRALAISLMVAIVAIQLLYGARYALIAWPNTEATRTTYNVLK